MSKQDGRQRAIIELVKPSLNNGQYPIKRVEGESVAVTATIIADGHDLIRARIRYRHDRQRTWREVDMAEAWQDHFTGTFTVDKKGAYQYTVIAWMDHALSWHRDIQKKIAALQKVTVELQMGALYCQAAAKQAGSADKQRLQELAKLLSDEAAYAEALEVVMQPELHDLFYRNPVIEHATTYHLNLQVQVEFQKALFSSWYEFFPRSAGRIPGKHGTFHDCINQLPRIAHLGFDTIYLPPIHPIGEVNRKGKNNSVTAEPGDVGSPWAIGSHLGGHKAIHPELGTFDDFQALVQAAGNYGIDIALDIAFQCAPDHPYVKDHPQWFKWRPDGTVQYAENPPKKYQDVLPLNFETSDWRNLWEELKSVFTFWIEHGIRVFRIDNPHTKSFGFWEWCIAAIRKDHPDTIFLAEAFTKPSVMQYLGKIGFNQSYTYFTWRPDRQSMEEYMRELTQTEMRDYYRPNFWPNTPDINPWELQIPNENLYMIRYFLAATLSSNYGMYGPVYEHMICDPVDGKEEYIYSEKYELKVWDWEKENRITRLISTVNAIRKANPALQTTWNLDLLENHNPHMMTYFKWDDADSNHLLIVVNMDPHNAQETSVKFPFHRLQAAVGERFLMSDLMTGNQFVWHDEWNYVRLDPFTMPFHLFKVNKL